MWEEVLKKYRNRIPQKARKLIDDLMADYEWRSVSEIYRLLDLSEFKHRRTGVEINDSHITPYLTYGIEFLREGGHWNKLRYEKQKKGTVTVYRLVR